MILDPRFGLVQIMELGLYVKHIINENIFPDWVSCSIIFGWTLDYMNLSLLPLGAGYK